jgi:transposase-like protein
MSKKRRHFSAEEKVAILKLHLLEKLPVSQICEQHDLYPNQFYHWLKDFFENGHLAFQTIRSSKSQSQQQLLHIAKLEAKLQQKDSVLAELMEEYVLLKKSLSDR